jgi:threonylcarbamoyladenosine tRNA methylthiotransferase MtaB
MQRTNDIHKTVSYYTLGCKLNFSETSSIAASLEESGYHKVNFEEGADVYVINTCSVTDHADRKCKKIVQQALKHNDKAFVAIIGCYAQLKPHEIATIPGVDLVLGAAEKFNIADYISTDGKLDKALVKDGKIKEVSHFIPAFSANDRTRTFLKVQDGCDYFCTFCTIPLARGKSRNATIAETVSQARKAASGGAKEIVLTGVNIGDFGQEVGESFYELIQELDKIEEVRRFRISSIEPNLLTDEIIDFVAQSKRFLPHFHIPLQSGNDRILELMRRKYKQELYTRRVNKIREVMPHASIGVDVITGFPSESDEDFLETYHYLNDLDISYLHVFTYSERKNTGALKIAGKVPHDTRKDRTNQLISLSEKKRRAYYDSFSGTTQHVLFEAENQESYMYGFTENYIKVRMPYDPLYINEIREVKLLSQTADGIMDIRLTNVEELSPALKARMAV